MEKPSEFLIRVPPFESGEGRHPFYLSIRVWSLNDRALMTIEAAA